MRELSSIAAEWWRMIVTAWTRQVSQMVPRLGGVMGDERKKDEWHAVDA
jgi:hypothetical protein